MRSMFFAFIISTFITGSLAYGKSNTDSYLNDAIAQEHKVANDTIAARPLIETYLQTYASSDSAPLSDMYSLSEVAAAKRATEDKFLVPGHVRLFDAATRNAKMLLVGTPEKISLANFEDMISPDMTGFNTKNYRFRFLKTAFLGNRAVRAYEVFPRDRKHETGRFLGRIWVDQQDRQIVRFTGVFKSDSFQGKPEFLHFDSWRKKSADNGKWRPYAIYMEDHVRGTIIKGQIRLWAYNLVHLGQTDESMATEIRRNDAADRNSTFQDISPLEATTLWRDQAEANVLERLAKAGLLAEPGDFEKILDQIDTNISIPNDLYFNDPVQVRILLTLPIEATAINNTIVISKGLLDTVPNEATLASVIALELAHIKLGHPLNTMFAFNDKLEFSNDSTYTHLCFAHSDKDNRAAAKLSEQFLMKSIYKGDLGKVAKYYAILGDRESTLKAISHGYLGDSLLAPDGQPWIASVLPNTTLKQAYSSPLDAPSALASVLGVDPDTDSVFQIRPRLAPGKDEAPPSLEILPVWINFSNDSQLEASLNNQMMSNPPSR